MRSHLPALATLFLSSCSVLAPTAAATPHPPRLSTQEAISTIVASGPMIEVSFNGTECILNGPSEIPLGPLVVKFTNSTGHIATPWVARNYPGKTWEDILDWIDTHPSETPGWIAILGYDFSVSETSTVSYRQYHLDLKAEYHIVAESLTDQFWPCGPFLVVETP